jgi:hypothetical protein
MLLVQGILLIFGTVALVPPVIHFYGARETLTAQVQAVLQKPQKLLKVRRCEEHARLLHDPSDYF